MEIQIHPIFEKYQVNGLTGEFKHITKKKWTKGCEHESGYLQYTFDGITMRVHRFIWTCFNGGIPEGHEINHINSIKTDNRLENLECISLAENRKKAVKTKEMLNTRAKNAHNKQRYVASKDLVTNEEKFFKSKNQASQYHGCSPSLVYMICEGKNRCKTMAGRVIFYYCDKKEDNELTILPDKRIGTIKVPIEIKKEKRKEAMKRYIAKKKIAQEIQQV